jgi:hypothetical protein
MFSSVFLSLALLLPQGDFVVREDAVTAPESLRTLSLAALALSGGAGTWYGGDRFETFAAELHFVVERRPAVACIDAAWADLSLRYDLARSAGLARGLFCPGIAQGLRWSVGDDWMRRFRVLGGWRFAVFVPGGDTEVDGETVRAPAAGFLLAELAGIEFFVVRERISLFLRQEIGRARFSYPEEGTVRREALTSAGLSLCLLLYL